MKHLFTMAGVAVALAMAAPAMAGDTTAPAQLQKWSARAGGPGNPERGRVFFEQKHGGNWSCASCHGAPPTRPGRHANTGKTLDTLAPAFNPRALTDTARTDKWFRRNCNDVLRRECTAGEKADILAYLVSLRP
jgi:hypothetical protein